MSHLPMTDLYLQVQRKFIIECACKGEREQLTLNLLRRQNTTTASCYETHRLISIIKNHQNTHTHIQIHSVNHTHARGNLSASSHRDSSFLSVPNDKSLHLARRKLHTSQEYYTRLFEPCAHVTVILSFSHPSVKSTHRTVLMCTPCASSIAGNASSAVASPSDDGGGYGSGKRIVVVCTESRWMRAREVCP